MAVPPGPEDAALVDPSAGLFSKCSGGLSITMSRTPSTPSLCGQLFRTPAAPHVLSVYRETRETVLEGGIVEREIKDLCARYLAEDGEALAALDDERLSERERAALAWADAIAWHCEAADDELDRVPLESRGSPARVGGTAWLGLE
jgi:hypothetical protein